MRLNKQITKTKHRLEEKAESYNQVAKTLGSQEIEGAVNESIVWPWVISGNYHILSHTFTLKVICKRACKPTEEKYVKLVNQIPRLTSLLTCLINDNR